MTSKKQAPLTEEQKAQYKIDCIVRLVSAAKKDCLHWIYEQIDLAAEQGKPESFPFTPEHAFGDTFLGALVGGQAETLKSFVKKTAVFIQAVEPVCYYFPPDLVFLIEEEHIPTLKMKFAKGIEDVHHEMREIIADYEESSGYEEDEDDSTTETAPSAPPTPAKEAEEEASNEDA